MWGPYPTAEILLLFTLMGVAGSCAYHGYKLKHYEGLKEELQSKELQALTQQFSVNQ